MTPHSVETNQGSGSYRYVAVTQHKGGDVLLEVQWQVGLRGVAQQHHRVRWGTYAGDAQGVQGYGLRGKG